MLLKLADLVDIILLKCIVSEKCLNACLKIGSLTLRDCSGSSCQLSATVTTVGVVWWTVVLLQSVMHMPTCIFEFCCRRLIHYFFNSNAKFKRGRWCLLNYLQESVIQLIHRCVQLIFWGSILLQELWARTRRMHNSWSLVNVPFVYKNCIRGNFSWKLHC